MLKKTLFFGNKTSLITKLEQLVIKTELRETTIPIEDIGFVVIDHPEIYISTRSFTAFFYLLPHNDIKHSLILSLNKKYLI